MSCVLLVLRNAIMGGGASSSKSSQKRTSLPSHVLQMLRSCLLSLPLPPGAIDEQVTNQLAQLAQRVEILEPQVILTKGQKAKGIFILVAGEAQVMSSSGDVLANLTPGDLFGELSTLYQIPCTATVKTASKALLLLLRPETLKVVLKEKLVPHSLTDYFVKKRYLDTSGAVHQSELMSKIAQAVLREVPLFKEWGVSALEALVQAVQAEGPAVTLASPESLLAMEGDPADEVIVIFKGRVEVLSDKEVLSTLDSSKWPVWIGEEGLFTGHHSQVLVRTVSSCQLIIIKNALINEVVKKFKNETVDDFTKRLDKWRHRTPGKDLDGNLGACYRLEVLIHRLSETPLLSEAPLNTLYQLVVNSRTKVFHAGNTIIGQGTTEQKRTKLMKSSSSDEHLSVRSSSEPNPTLPPGTSIKAAACSQVFWADDTFLLVLKGAVVLNGNQEWTCTDGEVLWVPKSAHPHTKLETPKDSVILTFTGSILDQSLSSHPDVTLIVPSTVR